MLLQLQLALLLSVQPQLLLLFLLPKTGNPQELSATSIISAALSNSPPRSPSQSVKTDVAGAEADSQSRSGSRGASYPVIQALGPFSSSGAAVYLCTSGLGCV